MAKAVQRCNEFVFRSRRDEEMRQLADSECSSSSQDLWPRKRTTDKLLFSFHSDHSGQEGDKKFSYFKRERHVEVFFSPQPCGGRNRKTAVKYLIAFGRICMSYRSLVSIITPVLHKFRPYFFVDVSKMLLRHKKSSKSRFHPTEER